MEQINVKKDKQYSLCFVKPYYSSIDIPKRKNQLQMGEVIERGEKIREDIFMGNSSPPPQPKESERNFKIR